MLRFITIFVMIMLCGVSAGLYHVKYSFNHMEGEGVALRLKIAQEKESIRILEAEWSNLNRPGRLQKLSERYLDLAPVQVSQIVDFEAIPVRFQDGGAPAPEGGENPIAKSKPVESGMAHAPSGQSRTFAVSQASVRGASR